MWKIWEAVISLAIGLFVIGAILYVTLGWLLVGSGVIYLDNWFIPRFLP